jgi:pilus assembly protein TadC
LRTPVDPGHAPLWRLGEGYVNREVRTALGAAAGLIALIVAFVILVRYLVPSVLGAPFSAALIAAVAVAVLGVLVLFWAAWRLWLWAVRSLNSR